MRLARASTDDSRPDGRILSEAGRLRITITNVSADDAARTEIARILARIAHRFADREAILWRAGHDDASFSALEAEAARVLLAEADRGDTRAIVAFARAFLETRGALLFASDGAGEDHATTLPRGLSDPARVSGAIGRANAFADPETTTSEGTPSFAVGADAAEAFQQAVAEDAKPSFSTTMNSAFNPFLRDADKRRR